MDANVEPRESDGAVRSRVRAFSVAVLALAAAVLLAGCASGGAVPPDTAPQPNPEVAPSLQPGDAIAVKVFREPDLSDTLRVDENHRIVLPLLGERSVRGISADSLKAQLATDLQEYVKTPAIEITVLRRVSILGAVRQPGLYPVDATYSLTDALALAGGTTPNADLEDIRLVRDGTVVRQDLSRGTLVEETPIRSGDQIVVGESGWFSRNWQWLAGTVISASLILITR